MDRQRSLPVTTKGAMQTFCPEQYWGHKVWGEVNTWRNVIENKRVQSPLIIRHDAGMCSEFRFQSEIIFWAAFKDWISCYTARKFSTAGKVRRGCSPNSKLLIFWGMCTSSVTKHCKTGNPYDFRHYQWGVKLDTLVIIEVVQEIMMFNTTSEVSAFFPLTQSSTPSFPFSIDTLLQWPVIGQNCWWDLEWDHSIMNIHWIQPYHYNNLLSIV